MKGMSSKSADSMPKSGGSKGSGIASPAHASVTGAAKVGSKMNMKSGSRSMGSKR